MTNTVFVYGTLKGMSKGKYLGTGVTNGLYVMWGEGFPRCIPVTDPRAQEYFDRAAPVRGELYEVTESELEYLDDYEGAPHYYDAYEVSIIPDYGDREPIKALMYHSKNAWDYLLTPVVKPSKDGTHNWQR